MKITEKNIARLHVGLTAPAVFTDDRLTGLCVTVTPRGKIRWLFRSQKKGTPVKTSIGPFPVIGYHEAYEAGLAISRDIFAGRTPEAAKARRTLSRKTLRPFVDQYLADNAASGAWQAATLKINTHSLEYLGGDIIDMAVADITAAVVRAQVEKIRDKWMQEIAGTVTNKFGTFPVVRPRQVGGKSSATRFISHMGVVLGLARAELGTDVMPYSADELVGNVKILTKRSLEAVVKNRAAAPYLQVPQLLSDMRSSGAIQPVHKCAVELAILNASRINEIVGGEWSEVDLDQGVWVVPAARMKGRTEYRQVHTLPLSPRSIEVLRELQSIAAAAGVQSQYIFDGALTAQGIAGKPISPSQVLKATIKKVPLRDADGAVVPVTMHGFRSTFKTWAEDTGKYKNSVSESQLDHAVGNKVQRAYDKSKRTALRHEMITDWADFVTGAKAFESVIDDTFQSARAV